MCPVVVSLVDLEAGVGVGVMVSDEEAPAADDSVCSSHSAWCYFARKDPVLGGGLNE